MIPETLMIPMTAGALFVALMQLRSVMLGKALPGCGPKSGCDEATSGRWSRVGPVPVSALGAAVYFAFLISAVLTHPQFPIAMDPDRLSHSLFFCALISAGAAVWFTALQALVIRKFCVYCSLAHLAGFAASVMAFWVVKPAESVFFAGMGLLMALILGQILFPPKLFTATGAQHVANPKREEEIVVPAPSAGFATMTIAPANAVEKVDEETSPVQTLVEEMPATETVEEPVEIISQAPTALDEQPQTDEPLPQESIADAGEADAAERAEDRLENERPAFDFVTGAMEEAVSALTATEEEQDETTAPTENMPEMEPQTVAAEVTQTARRLAVLDGKVSLSVRLWPVLGNPTARRMVIDLMDFTCKHCRQLHGLLRELIAQKPDEWAALMMPVPMDKECNPTMQSTPKEHEGSCEYTKLAMAVFHGNPQAFGAFEHWLCEGAEAPSLESVRAGAVEILGEEGLARALEDPRQGKRHNEALAIYDAVGQGQIPKLLLEKQLISGPVLTRGQLDEIIAKELELLGE